MEKFRGKFRTETTRLKNWDYASAGAYFVTICTHGREPFFGAVVDGEMKLSIMGEVAYQNWAEISAHFPHVNLDEFVIMPNHVHGILIIQNPVETRHGASLPSHNNAFGPLKRGSLQSVVNQYKASVTRWCNKNNQGAFAWQPLFYEHILRGETDLERVRNYIAQNPIQWAIDNENPIGLWI